MKLSGNCYPRGPRTHQDPREEGAAHPQGPFTIREAAAVEAPIKHEFPRDSRLHAPAGERPAGGRAEGSYFGATSRTFPRGRRQRPAASP